MNFGAWLRATGVWPVVVLLFLLPPHIGRRLLRRRRHFPRLSTHPVAVTSSFLRRVVVVGLCRVPALC